MICLFHKNSMSEFCYCIITLKHKLIVSIIISSVLKNPSMDQNTSTSTLKFSQQIQFSRIVIAVQFVHNFANCHSFSPIILKTHVALPKTELKTLCGPFSLVFQKHKNYWQLTCLCRYYRCFSFFFSFFLFFVLPLL